jgi:uncharacterized protein (TIGR02145 family)
MKKYLLITLSIVMSSISFSQKMTKEEKLAGRELYSKIWRAELKCLTGMDNRGYETYYTNNADTVKYVGLSDEYNSKIDEVEKYFQSNLFPMRYIGKIGNRYVYFPEGYAYSDNYYRLHMLRYQVGGRNGKINKFYNFSTPDGPALVLEFKNANKDTYYHGLIMLDELKELETKLANGQIGIMVDERDNSYYRWSKIGEQIWMAENLKYKLDEHSVMDKQIGYSNYKGRFYNYSQAMTSCPKGWHLPSDEEWKELELIAGVGPKDINVEGLISREGIDALPGAELIGSSQLMFYAHTPGAVSESYTRYSISAAGENGYFWTSTKSDEVNAKFRMVSPSFNGIVRDNMGAQNYFNCRCVEDVDISVMVQKYPKLKEATDKITVTPSKADNYFDRSIEFLLIGEGNRALTDINKAMELDPNNAEQKLFKAQILYLYSFDQNAEETRNLLADYLTSVKDNAFAYYFHSKLTLYDAKSGALNATRDDERRKKALSLIKKALALDPKNPQFLDYHAKLLVVTKEYAKAVKAIEKALVSDSQNGDLCFLLGKMKLKKYDQLNKKNGTNANRWCTAMTGKCFKVTTAQLESVCKDFTKAISLGATVNPDYITICSELEQAKTLKKHAPIVYTGPRGGRYTISSGGNKMYIPRR